MRIRKVDASGDMVFGHGARDFWQDAPEGVGLLIRDRLNLFVGDWFLDVTDGTDWRTKVLGKYTGSTRDAVLRARILGTTGVKSIVAYASQLNRETRAFSVQATVDTIYGQTTVASTL